MTEPEPTKEEWRALEKLARLESAAYSRGLMHGLALALAAALFALGARWLS